MHKFSDLPLQDDLAAAVEHLGYENPTPIQKAVIPLMIRGIDVVGQAQTGTGKTAAFALPIIQSIDKKNKKPRALVVTPTRELAIQVADAFGRYGNKRGIRPLAIYGGQSYDVQIRQIKRGVDVVVGTPGRLIDLLQQKKLDLSGVVTVVLDEADEMLSMGFIEDIERILAALPDDRQSALFSATMPPEIRRLAQRYLNDPETVAIAEDQLTVKKIEQRVYLVLEEEKLAALTRLFETEDITTALIFTRTRLETGRVANELTLRGYPAEALSGDLTQKAREHVLERFTDQKIKVLVATDIAARGLDIDHISHVINYDVPQFPEIYVHRIGRTGRAGREGTAITLLSPRERHRLRRIEQYTGQKLTISSLPTDAEIWETRDQFLLDRLRVWLTRDRYKKEKAMVAGLIAEGFDPEDLAAAALKLARAQERHRPLARIRHLDPNAEFSKGPSQRKERNRGRQPSDKQRERGPRKRDRRMEPGMVRYQIDVGRADGIRPADIVREVATTAGIKGSRLGAIIIDHNQTFFDVPEADAEKVFNAREKLQFWGRPVSLNKI